MKHKAKSLLAFLAFAAASVLYPVVAASGEELTEQTALVDIMLKIELPELEGIIPPLLFEKRAEVIYYSGKYTLEVDSEDFPVLMYDIGENPLGSHLTIAISPLDGTTIIAYWDDTPTVTVEDVDLTVKAYKLPIENITEDSIALFQGNIYGVTLTSGKIKHEDYTLEGRIDPDIPSITLVFITEFPITGIDIIDTFLAGQTILGELTISVVNPYEKENIDQYKMLYIQ